MHRSLYVALLVFGGCTENTLNPSEGNNTATPRIAVTPGAVDFGQVPLSEVGVEVVTIGNEGDAGLTLDEIGIAGPIAFSYTWPEPVDMLAPGETTEVVVEYRPGATNESGWLSIASNDPSRAEVDVPLYGAAAFGLLQIQPNPVEFSGMNAGETRVEEALLVNVGGDALTVDALLVQGAGFSIVTQPELPVTIPANTALSGLELAFESTVDGVFLGQLFAHSDAPQPETTAELHAYVGFGNISGQICSPNDVGFAAGVHVWVAGTYPNGTDWLVETWTDANGEFTLENVPLGTHTVYAERGSWSTSFEVTITGGTYELPVPECLDPDSAKVAVVTGDYDHIETVLSRLGIDYDSYPGAGGANTYMNLLSDPELMATYDIIFFNCGMSFGWLNSRGEVAANLRDFVAEGGSVYASDWAWGVVEESWPTAIDFYGNPDTPWDPNTWVTGPFTPYVGVADTSGLSADVHDPNMAATVGGTADIVFDLDAWVVPESAQSSVLVSGDVTLYADWEFGTTSALAGAPLVIRHDTGEGTVIYTAFHNDQQATADALAILAEIILSL